MSYTDRFKNQEKPTLLQFYADWCPPCRMLSPVVQELSEEHASQLHVEQINVDTHQDIAAEFGVRSVPVMFLLKEDNIVWEHVGFMPKAQLTQELEQATDLQLSQS